ncbi:MAG TPA: hypothetical protein VM074_01460 [Solimonas sp.]|nr:hypothetical protein [Solimonas sp.]
MRLVAAWLLLLASGSVLGAVPAKCTPPAKAGTVLGMPGCVQPDGTLLTEKGFRIGLRRGTGAVEITPPKGAGFEAGNIDAQLDESADALQAEADKPDAGLERHAMREAAEIQRRFANDVRELVAETMDIETPSKGAKPAAAPAPTAPGLEAWCRDMSATAAWSKGHWAGALAGQKQTPATFGPIPPPPSVDYFDCYGCDLDKQKQAEKDAREWASKQWFGNYIEPETRTLKAMIEYSKKLEADPALAQAMQQPGSACATLAATGAHMRGGFSAPLFKIALSRRGDKALKLEREYGKPKQYATYQAVRLAYITQMKEDQLVTCTEFHPATLHFLGTQMAQLNVEMERKLRKDKDLRQLGSLAFRLALDKEAALAFSSHPSLKDTIYFINQGILDVKLDFQVKLGGQGAGGNGYVLARVKGSTPMYAYVDPKDRKCGLLRSVEMENDLPKDRPMLLKIVNAEMFGPGLRNNYIGAKEFKSTVVIDLPCCRKNQASDQAFVYIESLGPRAVANEKETWSRPEYAPFPVIDNWFRLAFNIGSLMKMVDSGQADAETAQLEKDMAVKQQEMDELQARYDRGEATLADLVAGANEMKESLSGGGSVGKNAFLSQAQHYRLEVPFQNNQASAIKVKLDARTLLQGGSEAEEGLRKNLVYGFGDVELTLRPVVLGKPGPETLEETQRRHQNRD